MSSFTVQGLLGLATVVFLHTAVRAQESVSVPAGPVADLLRCRELAGESARLTCFDAAVAGIEQAVRAGDLRVVDRAVLAEEQSARFGLREADRARGAVEQPEELSAAVKSAQKTLDGWVVTLEDGSVWRQIDARTSPVDPVVGQVVTIKRAALGSYRLLLNSNVGFRVRRVR